MTADSSFKIIIVFGRHLVPCHFGKGKHTWECKILGIIFRPVFVQYAELLKYRAMYELIGPETSLNTKHRGCG